MIGKDSYRIQAVVNKSEGTAIELIAANEDRSVSNWVAMVIRKELHSPRTKIKREYLKKIKKEK